VPDHSQRPNARAEAEAAPRPETRPPPPPAEVAEVTPVQPVPEAVAEATPEQAPPPQLLAQPPPLAEVVTETPEQAPPVTPGATLAQPEAVATEILEQAAEAAPEGVEVVEAILGPLIPGTGPLTSPTLPVPHQTQPATPARAQEATSPPGEEEEAHVSGESPHVEDGAVDGVVLQAAHQG